jgi:23S rRNA pseudouridine2605 synthase
MARKNNDDKTGYGERKRRPWQRGKALKSTLPRPEPARPPVPKKDAERIAKVIARAGLCSRRDAEDWIAAGRVSVNGAVIASPALNVTGKDSISVDGKPLPVRERTRLFLYHKPADLVTTNDDPQGRPTIFDALPEDLPRLLTVGRLDIGTEGLLLLTNDGGLARVLELPETGWLRRYRVRAHGEVRQDQLDSLRSGLTVDGIHYGPIEATLDRTQGANVWLTFSIREGKNREVRNVLGAIGLQVNRLIRVSFGPFQLADLAEGEVEEVKTRILREQLGDRVAQSAGCDFSGPIVTIPPLAATPQFTSPHLRGEVDRSKARSGEAGSRRIERVEKAPHPTLSPQAGRGRPRIESTTRSTYRPAFSGRDDRRERHKRQIGDADYRSDDRHGQRTRNVEASADQPAKKPRKQRSSSFWRDHPASGKRKFHGSRRDEKRGPEEAPGKRAGLLKDRRGRRILVERFGTPKLPEPEPAPRPKPRRPPRRDRSGGPRPSRPKGR